MVALSNKIKIQVIDDEDTEDISKKKSKKIKKANPVVEKKKIAISEKRIIEKIEPKKTAKKIEIAKIEDDGDNEEDEGAIKVERDIVKETIESSIKEDIDREEEDVFEKKVNFSRSIKLYKRIAYFFIGLVILLMASIFYFTIVRIKIILIPNQERINNNMIVDIYNKGSMETAQNNSIEGIVKEINVNYSKTYSATGEDVIGKEAVGVVEIINNYNQNQPLVATTRLLTPDGKLFRIKNTVNVPAGSSIKADIYADEPSPEMAVGPTKFTLPGLWAGLQDKIYAVSEESVVYGQKVKKYIKEEDIDNGIRDLKLELLSKAKNDINQTYDKYGQIIYKINENSIKSDYEVKIGDEVDDFEITMDADVIVVAFDDVAYAELANKKLISSLPTNKELLSFDDKNIIYTLNNYNEKLETATVNATFEGKVSLKENSNIIDKEKIIGLNKSQLDAYLASLPEIARFEIKFYPSFIKKIPKFIEPGKIEIEVRK